MEALEFIWTVIVVMDISIYPISARHFLSPSSDNGSSLLSLYHILLPNYLGVSVV